MSFESVLVVGVCAPERHRYAESIGELSVRTVHFEPGGPRHGGRGSRSWANGDGLIVEAATDVDLAHLLGGDEPAPVVVCVVDAPHMIDDLCDGVPLLEHAPVGDDRGDVGARGRQAASFIEAASVVVLVNWERVDTARLSVLMALASHLGPTARIRLARDPIDDLRGVETAEREDVWQERAGWVRVLNGEHDPYMRDRRVETFRYEQVRPFHPGRLVRALSDQLDPARVGLLLRSAGFCRLATRASMLARWEQAGSAMWIDPLTFDDEMQSTSQEIAFTGLDLHVEHIRQVLDGAALTDDELLAGPTAWGRFDDPLPEWPVEAGETKRTES